MRRVSVLIVTACVLAGTAGAYPGIWGSRGLFRVQDARTEGNWQLSISTHALHRSISFADIPDQWRMGYDSTMTAYTEDFTAAIGISPVKYFELFYWTGGLREFSSKHPDSSVVDQAWLKGYENFGDWHNSVPGAKLSLPVFPVVKLGALVAYGMDRDGDGENGYDPTGWRWGVFGIPPIGDLAWSGLATFDLRDVQAGLPTFHVNYGQLGSGNTSLGGAVEYEIGKLDIFAEFVTEQSSDTSSWAGDKMYVSPGVKIGYLRPLIIDLGASFGLNDATPKMELDAGLSTTFTFFKPPKRTTGAIAGKVSDAKTGAPLGATVGLPDEPGLTPVKADSKTGAFKVAKVKAGQVLVEATAKGYQPRTAAAEVVIGKTAQVEFQLEPIVTKGTISGMVVDAKTGSSLQASIECEGAKLKPVGTASDGSFGYSDVAPGEYVLGTSAPDYMKATSTVKVEAGQTARLKIALVKKGMEITMKVYFDFNKADLKPESHQALADAAQIMKENPDIRVEIQGHTDNVGAVAYNDKLSLRRAKAVVDYLVSKLGVDAKRLTAKGYGLGAPVASNDNEEGRSKNRRVEFSILK